MGEIEIGILGGSGLYELELEGAGWVELDTPFGRPSDAFRVGTLEGRRVGFLARHGRGHRFLPTEVPFRANLWALKSLGATRILSASAVGSLREEVHPREIVVPDQFLDRTRHRADSFFGEGVVVHVSFGDPLCPELREHLVAAGREASLTMHDGGTYVCMEGPQFSTRAESELYRSWGASVIGMTNLTEARLAREAELCYATLALVTDYDCWHETEEEVSVEAVVANLMANASNAARLLRLALQRIPGERALCGCGEALKNAILTAPGAIPAEARERLALLIGHRLPERPGCGRRARFFTDAGSSAKIGGCQAGKGPCTP